jgi:hypothetical protein
MVKDSVFIPLNCVDKGLVALNEIRECLRFHWILRICSEVDYTLLNEALLKALEDHPNLRTRLCTRYMRPFRRIYDAREGNIMTRLDLYQLQQANGLTAAEVDKRYEEILANWLNGPFSAFEEFPLRVLFIRKSSSDLYLIFTFDHSALDGLRAIRFIREVFRRYDGDETPKISLLKDFRHSKGDELLEFARAKRAKTKGFRHRILFNLLHRFLVGPIRPPARIFCHSSRWSEEINCCFRMMDPVDTGQIGVKARAAHVTVNDVLLAACFKAIERWNGLHGKKSQKITIMVPVDIGPVTFGDVISNQLSYISLATLPRDREDVLVMLRKIRKDITSMVKEGIQFSIIYFLHFASALPLPLAKVLAKSFMLTRVYVDTTIFSNLGVVHPESWEKSRISSARIADINGVMPLVTPMRLSLGAYIYNGSLHFNMTYKTSFFSKDEAQEFLNLYLEEVRTILK